MKLANFFRLNSSEISEQIPMNSPVSTPLLKEGNIQLNSDKQYFFSKLMEKNSVLRYLGKNIFTVFSLALGGIVTFYNLRDATDKEGSLSENVYLAYGFAISGILWRLNWKSSDVIPTILSLEEKDTEIKIKDKKNLQAQQSIFPAELTEDTPILGDNNIQNIAYQKQIGSFTIKRIGHNIIPSAWLTQSVYLFVRSALNEGPNNYIFPYTILIGLATGLLFHLSIQPWSLMGAREWIQKKRNLLSALEFLIFTSLRIYQNSNIPYLFYFLTASFWSGYNLYDGAVTLLGKYSNQNISTENTLTATSIHVQLKSVLSRCIQILSFLSGAGLIASSILLLSYLEVADTMMRNTEAKLMGAVGCYLSTYSLGVYLGQKINPRYHSRILFLCTYLLVPFASPGLSVIHYLALMNGGLCGGIAHSVVTQQYHNRILSMQEIQLQLNQLAKQYPQWLLEFKQVMLPTDLLLVQHRKKSYKIKQVISLMAFFTAVFGALGIGFNTATQTSIPLCSISYLVAVHWLMPKFHPNVYSTKLLSFLSRIFYTNSFSIAYMFKITYLIVMDNEFDEVSSEPRSNSSAVDWISIPLLNLFLGLLGSITVHKLFNGGYIPYVPRQSDVNSLEKLCQTVADGNLKLTYPPKNREMPKELLSYYFLNFMQINLSIDRDQLEEKEFKLVKPNEPKKDIVDPEMKLSFADCPHPLKQCAFFHHQRQDTEQYNQPHSLLAKLHCHQCDSDVLNIEGYYSREDENYTASRFDASFEERVFDSTFRGYTIPHQYPFGLPPELSFDQNIRKFTF